MKLKDELKDGPENKVKVKVKVSKRHDPPNSTPYS